MPALEGDKQVGLELLAPRTAGDDGEKGVHAFTMPSSALGTGHRRQLQACNVVVRPSPSCGTQPVPYARHTGWFEN